MRAKGMRGKGLALPPGLSRETVERISRDKGEPSWMREFRLRAFEEFLKKRMPQWGPDLSPLDFGKLTYYAREAGGIGRSWSAVPAGIRKTFERLGIPQAERKWLAGVSAQWESRAVYESLREGLRGQGVTFMETDEALRERPGLFREWFGKIVPPGDNKFAALNSAVWSGGAFLHVPAGVRVEAPLQAYFRINAPSMGQFERTLIVLEEGASAHYIEGCTAPRYSASSLHAGVVEIVVKEGAHLRYTTIQNWAGNIYNLVTKRAHAHRNSVVEWVDGNIGSKVTMKYPSVHLLGEGARADLLSLSIAGKGQMQDLGGKALHLAPNTASTIVSKSVCNGGGRSSYRGLVQVREGCSGVTSRVRCDALLLDGKSRADTYPVMDVRERSATVSHEATVGRIGEEQMFYLRSRGLKENDAAALAVLGFLEPVAKELPMEYAVELNRLVQMEMEGSVG